MDEICWKFEKLKIPTIDAHSTNLDILCKIYLKAIDFN